MAKLPGFAKAIAGRWRTVEMDIRLRCKRDFLRTVTPALLTDGLRIEGGI